MRRDQLIKIILALLFAIFGDLFWEIINCIVDICGQNLFRTIVYSIISALIMGPICNKIRKWLGWE
jgi:uncharacterized membrane protein YczE